MMGFSKQNFIPSSAKLLRTAVTQDSILLTLSLNLKSFLKLPTPSLSSIKINVRSVNSSHLSKKDGTTSQTEFTSRFRD
jgi:hypothetical protein